MYRRAIAVMAALLIAAVILDYNGVGQQTSPTQQQSPQQTQS